MTLEFLPIDWVVVWSEVGRRLVRCLCPFCNIGVHGFAWSIAGTGKLCPRCGALLGWSSALRDKDKPMPSRWPQPGGVS